MNFPMLDLNLALFYFRFQRDLGLSSGSPHEILNSENSDFQGIRRAIRESDNHRKIPRNIHEDEKLVGGVNWSQDFVPERWGIKANDIILQDINVAMRRQSFSSNLNSGNSGAGEPLIVVEESTLGEEEAERCRAESPPRCVDPDSPSLNPYLLSPWRDARKHSLPTPQCTSGITASQVHEASEVSCARTREVVGQCWYANTVARNTIGNTVIRK